MHPKQLTGLLLHIQAVFLCVLLRPTSVFRLHRRSTRFALALPALPATLCPKEHRTRMARTKFNGNASDWFRQDDDARAFFRSALKGEIEVGISPAAA